MVTMQAIEDSNENVERGLSEELKVAQVAKYNQEVAAEDYRLRYEADLTSAANYELANEIAKKSLLGEYAVNQLARRRAASEAFSKENIGSLHASALEENKKLSL